MKKSIDHEKDSAQAGIAPELQDTSPTPAQILALRLKAIEEYKLAALRAPDPLRAALGATTAALLELDHEIERTIMAGLAAHPQQARAVMTAMPMIDVHLRVQRQLDRFLQFEQRSLAAEQAQQRAAGGRQSEESAF